MTPKEVVELMKKHNVVAVDFRFMDFPGIWQHTSFPAHEITEETFDQNLNPIRVKIDLCMQVLGSSDFKSGSVGNEIYTNYQTQKKALTLLYRRDPI